MGYYSSFRWEFIDPTKVDMEKKKELEVFFADSDNEDVKVRLIFHGEDDEVWGYRVSPGKVEDLFCVFLTASEYERVREIF
ncbi:hypothetical protein [Hippea maritima]|uniref:Uncharacterized protein n=1 Tax=Hippea maritima (strain ATCC 700847 / DSM 10411 / MH2) TaxID=760142 RepID=F2LV43_HIPMA|nr:hypothetical protein [Hippea maritima]AEA33627.1 hypothetical protein Hipma_0657 [Hippea maritima DSM 10411]